MIDIACFGHITVDLYFKSDSFTHNQNRLKLAIGGKYFADKFIQKIGGGGYNCAVGCSRNGLKPALIATIGNNEFRSFLLKTIKKNKILTNYLQTAKDYIAVSAIILTETGDKTVISYQKHKTRLISKNKLEKLAKLCQYFYFGNMQEFSLSKRIKILRFLKKQNKFIFANFGVEDCRKSTSMLEKAISNVDVLIQNEYEIADILKKPHKELNFELNLAQTEPLLKGKTIVVTFGKKGSICYTAKASFYQPAKRVKKVADTTGAGDAYTAGFISTFIKTGDIKLSMKNATKYSASILKEIGAN
ncbi:MAG: sugar kinase [Patescibacteria group bacterium]|nr:MAG: sugar kinase [Patescibacteria group bacterium]